MSEIWPPGRTEEDLLDRVYKRARTLRIRRRARAAGALSVVAAGVLVPILAVHPGQASQSVSTAGQTANPPASSARTSSSGTASSPGGRDQAGTPTSTGSSGLSSLPVLGLGASTPGSNQGGTGPQPTTPGPSHSSGPTSTTVLSGPRVTSVDPAYGPTTGGTRVTLSGVDLRNVTEVIFGSVTITSFTVTSGSTIVVVSPASPDPGMVPIGVYNSRHQGYSDAACWDNPLCSDGFLYTPPPVWGRNPILPIPNLKNPARDPSELKALLSGR